MPYVIEPAAGVNRTMAAFLLAAYDEDEVGGETRTVLRLHPRLAPYKVAVLPLSKKDTLTPLGQRVLATLAERYMVDYDETQAIGSATAARTRSARRCASPSTSTRSTTTRSRSATATPPSRSGCRSTACSPRSPTGSAISDRVTQLRSSPHGVVPLSSPNVDEQAGKRDALTEVLRKFVAGTESEPGTLTYILHHDAKDADVLWFYESTSRRRPSSAHGKSETMATVGPGARPVPRRSPGADVPEPVAGKGL